MLLKVFRILDSLIDDKDVIDEIINYTYDMNKINDLIIQDDKIIDIIIDENKRRYQRVYSIKSLLDKGYYRDYRSNKIEWNSVINKCNSITWEYGIEDRGINVNCLCGSSLLSRVGNHIYTNKHMEFVNNFIQQTNGMLDNPKDILINIIKLEPIKM